MELAKGLLSLGFVRCFSAVTAILSPPHAGMASKEPPLTHGCDSPAL